MVRLSGWQTEKTAQQGPVHARGRRLGREVVLPVLSVGLAVALATPGLRGLLPGTDSRRQAQRVDPHPRVLEPTAFEVIRELSLKAGDDLIVDEYSNASQIVIPPIPIEPGPLAITFGFGERVGRQRPAGRARIFWVLGDVEFTGNQAEWLVASRGALASMVFDPGAVDSNDRTIRMRLDLPAGWNGAQPESVKVLVPRGFPALRAVRGEERVSVQCRPREALTVEARPWGSGTLRTAVAVLDPGGLAGEWFAVARVGESGGAAAPEWRTRVGGRPDRLTTASPWTRVDFDLSRWRGTTVVVKLTVEPAAEGGQRAGEGAVLWQLPALF